MKNLVHFSFGFYVGESNSYQTMSLLTVDAIMTTDILVAEGVRQYLLEHQLLSRLFPLIRLSHDSILKLPIDINAVLTTDVSLFSLGKFYKIIKIWKPSATVK